MFQASIFTKSKIANAEFGATAYTPADTLVIKLFTTTLDLNGTGTELVATGYEPLEIANNLTNFPTTTTGIKTNGVNFEMSMLEEDSDEIAAIGIFDDADNLLYRKNVDTPFVIENGQYLNFAPGDITLTVS
ncbi:MAG: hypothetical protein LUM44_09690 [Pyrinomonadaceae bacterium]|nr:hypothetical protein [Pyrinomonadaceae bacterium]